MPSAKLIQKLKPALQNPLPPEQGGILLCLDSDSVTGDNAKYMNMYNRLARPPISSNNNTKKAYSRGTTSKTPIST